MTATRTELKSTQPRNVVGIVWIAALANSKG